LLIFALGGIRAKKVLEGLLKGQEGIKKIEHFGSKAFGVVPRVIGQGKRF